MFLSISGILWTFTVWRCYFHFQCNNFTESTYTYDDRFGFCSVVSILHTVTGWPRVVHLSESFTVLWYKFLMKTQRGPAERDGVFSREKLLETNVFQYLLLQINQQWLHARYFNNTTNIHGKNIAFIYIYIVTFTARELLRLGFSPFFF